MNLARVATLLRELADAVEAKEAVTDEERLALTRTLREFLQELERENVRRHFAHPSRQHLKPRERLGIRHEQGKVYFVQAKDGGPIKIGKAKHVESRLMTMQIGSPVELIVLLTVDGYSEVEASLHRRFVEHRLHGEWFSAHEEILTFIRERT